MDEYKGIYYDDDTEQKFYEGGAHFKYIELYKKLELIYQEQKAINLNIENSKVYYYIYLNYIF
jgi:hypothetical protein